MKKIIILSIILCGIISADILPYKPKPILWMHGLGGSSSDWGAPTRNREDWIPAESIAAHPNETYAKFLNNYMLPIVWIWYNYEKDHGLPITYTIPTDPAYPNKTFLEVINFDWNNGSIDPDSTWDCWPPYCDQPGQGWELRQRIKELRDCRNNNLFFCHSFGKRGPGMYGFRVRHGMTFPFPVILKKGVADTRLKNLEDSSAHTVLLRMTEEKKGMTVQKVAE